MILLLGATTYIGQGFARTLRRRRDSFVPLSKSAFDYTRFELLFDYVRKMKPELVINAAEYSEKPTRGAEDLDRTAMFRANALLPQTIARVCALTNTTLGHVSSGSVYLGAKILENGTFRVEEDLGLPQTRALFASHPERFRGFSEMDEPNFSFRHAPCTFYCGTKAIAEEALRDMTSYIWRMRLPFNERDAPGNFLSQLQDGFRFRDAINSLSHLDECVNACLELWERRAPVGIYNVVNPGPLRTLDVFRMLQRYVELPRRFELVLYEPAGLSAADLRVRPDCILDGSKLLNCGVKLRSARQALQQSLQKWEPRSTSAMQTLQ